MKTEILKIDPQETDSDKIKYAANIIKAGGLVVFPTETVYGLGANALMETAVQKIYHAKGRPSDNPLIVHVAHKEQLDFLSPNVSDLSYDLIAKYWPGPLTLVMPKTDKVPAMITAGLDTVAIRMPNHPVALSLIYEAGVPLAAPSANRSGRPSPTLAAHVLEDLDGRVDLIIDSGPCAVGLESTVLDVSIRPPVILRPGGVTFEDLQSWIPNVRKGDGDLSEEKQVPRAPGMKYSHYAPKAQLVVVKGKPQRVAHVIEKLVSTALLQHKKVGILATDETMAFYKAVQADIVSLGSRYEQLSIANRLFASFRSMDEKGMEIVYAEAVEESGIGVAVMNRMHKASGYDIIEVD